ncbi:MAG: hypothetical protein ACREQ2_10495 [Candidatus Binatia bacterium]
MRQLSAEPAGVRAHANRVIGVCLLMLALAVMFSSCAESVKHDEAQAAKRALELGRVVFLEKNLDKGYDLLSAGGRRYLPRDKFKQSIAAMHARDYPTKLTAIEYEPMADEKAIYIFLNGHNSEEQFSYRLTMEGTATTDYKVLKIDQGKGFFTLSNKKQAFKPPLSVP